MSQLEHQQSILGLLKDFRGPNPLKDLFWSELNYERVNKSLSRRGWTDTAAKALAEAPVLFAAGGQDDSFHVIYARLASDRLLLGHERPVVSRLLRDHPYALFGFSNEPQDRWHFVNVKYDDKTDERRIFRHITIGPEERLRTATERIEPTGTFVEPTGTFVQNVHSSSRTACPLRSVFVDLRLALGIAIAIFSKSTAHEYFLENLPIRLIQRSQ